jgi:hypothetical protein
MSSMWSRRRGWPTDRLDIPLVLETPQPTLRPRGNDGIAMTLAPISLGHLLATLAFARRIEAPNGTEGDLAAKARRWGWVDAPLFRAGGVRQAV